MSQSDKLIRFDSHAKNEYTAKQHQRTELQKHIEEWEAKGNKIEIAPPFVCVPRPIVWRNPIVKTPAPLFEHGIDWGQEEIRAVRYMKAIGLTNLNISVALNAHYGNKRTHGAVKRICQQHGIYRIIEGGTNARRRVG